MHTPLQALHCICYLKLNWRLTAPFQLFLHRKSGHIPSHALCSFALDGHHLNDPLPSDVEHTRETCRTATASSAGNVHSFSFLSFVFLLGKVFHALPKVVNM